MDLVEAKARALEAGNRHPWEHARVSLVARLIARRVRLQPGDAVLDIGCGDTFVIEQLARRYPGVHFHGVDTAFTPELVATFEARLDRPNVSLFASLDEVAAPRPAALVLLMDVLEHVPDDVGLLRDLCGRPCVGPDTRFLITVPSYNWLFGAHDRFMGHHRRYSTSTFRGLLDRSRLVRLDGGQLFTTLVPLRGLAVLRERLVGGVESSGIATWAGGAFTTRALTAALAFDGRLALALARLGITLPGLSTYAICRKSA